MNKKSRWFLMVLVLLGLVFMGEGLIAQDDLDVKGLETEEADDGGAEKGEKSLFTMIGEGGWAMIPLGLMSVAIIALSIYLFMDISVKNFTPPELVNGMRGSVEAGDIHAALEQASVSPSCLGQVMHGALEYTAKRGAHVLDGDTIYDLMADASQHANRGRASVVNYLAVISQAAPMLGLLGTVSGMIKAFALLETSGMGDPSKLAGAISEALMTTATGLVIALPAIFLYFYFKNRLAKFIAETDLEANRELNTLRDVWVDMAENSQAAETTPGAEG